MAQDNQPSPVAEAQQPAVEAAAPTAKQPCTVSRNLSGRTWKTPHVKFALARRDTQAID